MSAAFQLQPCESRCGYPKCILPAFHDGDHELSGITFLAHPDEANERLAALVTSYGVGTRSYNRSAEKHELDRQIAEAKQKAENLPKREYLAPLLCPCPQRPYAHELSIHENIRPESYNPARRFRWPWSLCLASREEPSTERTYA